MFIQTEETPNPDCLKFLPGKTVMGEGEPLFFLKPRKNHPDFRDGALKEEVANAINSQKSPLADRILAIEEIESVFLGADFISVTKVPTIDWYIIKPLIVGAIVEHLTSADPVVLDDLLSERTPIHEFHDELSLQIQEIIDTKIRPAVAQDGGDIIFRSFEDGVVFVEMRGACSGCPSSIITLKTGMENMLRYYIPEIKEVRSL